MCRISIADRGQGIPDDIRERVFEPFFTTRATGTGLGLAIVRRLVELQDGTVTLRERDGGGTIAEVTLPIATSGASAVTSSCSAVMWHLHFRGHRVRRRWNALRTRTWCDSQAFGGRASTGVCDRHRKR